MVVLLVLALGLFGRLAHRQDVLDAGKPVVTSELSAITRSPRNDANVWPSISVVVLPTATLPGGAYAATGASER